MANPYEPYTPTARRRRIDGLGPAAVRAYLLAHGWTEHPSFDPRVTSFEHAGVEASLLVPLADTLFGDLGLRSAEAINVLSHLEDREPIDIIADIEALDGVDTQEGRS
jgi:hypothetical protein